MRENRMPIWQIAVMLVVIGVLLLLLLHRPAPVEPPTLAFITRTGQPGSYDGALFRIDANGSHLQRLTEKARPWFAPIWSPDGKQILFVMESELWIVDADGRNQRKITQDADISYQPAWSPDGQAIVLVSNNNLSVIDLNGNTLRHLTNQANAKSGKYGYSYPSWSPDGKYIAFEGFYRPAKNSDIFIVDASCTDPDSCHNLFPINSGADEHSYDWSPDSQSIVFASTRQGLFSLFMMNLGSGEIQRLTSSDTLYSVNPRWSPDGKKIIFVSSNRDATENFITLIYPDGSHGWTLPVEEASQLSWSPDSQYFAYGAGQAIHTQSAANRNVSSSIDIPDIDTQTIAWRP
jgi:TolB protein